jgi:hypothetical protein
MAGVPLPKVLSKRTMGLALTAYIIHEGTPPEGVAGSETHPSSADRFSESIGMAAVPEDMDCWCYASALLVAILTRMRRFTTDVTFTSAKELCLKLIGLLREANP